MSSHNNPLDRSLPHPLHRNPNETLIALRSLAAAVGEEGGIGALLSTFGALMAAEIPIGRVALRHLVRFLAAVLYFHSSEYALAVAFHGRSNVSPACELSNPPLSGLISILFRIAVCSNLRFIFCFDLSCFKC